ncbi:MAG: hypothetical protein V8R85_07430 [Frisingicoccus sp.]
MADRKSRQMIHRARKRNPEAVIVAAGCYVQTAKEAAEADEAIDLIVGNNCKGQILELVESFAAQMAPESWLDINEKCDYEALSITKVSEHTRAYIKIQMVAMGFVPVYYSLCPGKGAEPETGRYSFRGFSSGPGRI